MHYTIDGIKYEGISKTVTKGAILVLVTFEGDEEIWFINAVEKLKDLKQIYESLWGADRVTFKLYTEFKK